MGYKDEDVAGMKEFIVSMIIHYMNLGCNKEQVTEYFSAAVAEAFSELELERKRG